MTTAELEALVKFELFDSDYAGMWTRDYLRFVMNEGQKKFCEDTGYFVDSVNFTIFVTPASIHYSLDERIIQVLNVYSGDAALPTPILTFAELGLITQDVTFTPNSVQAYTLEQQTGYLTVFPQPVADETLTLRVWRYPLHDMDDTHGPEIPSRFYSAIIQYACYKALMKHDAEIADPIKAKDHLAAYYQIVTEAKRAVELKMNTTPILAVNPSYIV